MTALDDHLPNVATGIGGERFVWLSEGTLAVWLCEAAHRPETTPWMAEPDWTPCPDHERAASVLVSRLLAAQPAAPEAEE